MLGENNMKITQHLPSIKKHSSFKFLQSNKLGMLSPCRSALSTQKLLRDGSCMLVWELWGKRVETKRLLRRLPLQAIQESSDPGGESQYRVDVREGDMLDRPSDYRHLKINASTKGRACSVLIRGSHYIKWSIVY